jgi:hypothetical protein
VRVFVAGMVPMIVLITCFKVFLAPSAHPVETFEHVASPERYGQILWGFYDQAKGFGGTWRTGGIHPFVLVLLLILLYPPVIRSVRDILSNSSSLVLLILFMLGGYAMVYLFSSFGTVQGYIGGSLDRLLLQLWPASLFILTTLSPPASGRAIPTGTAALGRGQ